MSGFDIIYATLDEAFDRGHGVRSMVQWLGRPRALRVSGTLHLVAFFCLIGALLALRSTGDCHNAAVADLALVVAGVLLFLEQRWAENVDLAFFKVNVWVGFAVLALVIAARASCGGF